MYNHGAAHFLPETTSQRDFFLSKTVRFENFVHMRMHAESEFKQEFIIMNFSVETWEARCLGISMSLEQGKGERKKINNKTHQ